MAFQFQRVVRDFSVPQNVHTRSGAHPASYIADTGGSLPGLKRPAREADHASPSNAKFENGWNCSFMCLRVVRRGNCTCDSGYFN